MTKAEMLEIINDNGWSSLLDVNSESSYQEVKDAFEVMLDEMSSDSDMFPNGHDDGEDFY